MGRFFCTTDRNTALYVPSVGSAERSVVRISASAGCQTDRSLRLERSGHCTTQARRDTADLRGNHYE